MSDNKKVPVSKEEPKPVTTQVQTLVSIEQQRIVLACPKCGTQQTLVGVKFCSNCAHSLRWDNIAVLPPAPTPEVEAEVVEK